MRWSFEKPPTTVFEFAVHRAVQAIPPSRVATYGDVAAAVGHPGAARAVGNVMKACLDDEATPCHRVVRSDGHVGGYGDDWPTRKIRRLRAEGLRVTAEGWIEDFGRARFDYSSPLPSRRRRSLPMAPR